MISGLQQNLAISMVHYLEKMGCGNSAELQDLKSKVATDANEIEKLKRNLDESMSADQATKLKTEKEKADLVAKHTALKEEHGLCSSTAFTLHKEIEDKAAAISQLTAELAKLRAECDEVKDRHSRELENALRTRTSGPKLRDCIRLNKSAKIGTTGKYYCRQVKNNGTCGPLTGNNCLECQKLDIEARDLPNGFLVNGESRICRRGSDGRTWYCGAGVLQNNPASDGWCGPTNGPQCNSCKELQALVEDSYRELLNN